MAKHRIDIRGTIIPNDYKRVYDWYGFDSTCPRDVSTVLDRMMDADEVYVYINSPGGHIEPGSEIYTLLRQAIPYSAIPCPFGCIHPRQPRHIR